MLNFTLYEGLTTIFAYRKVVPPYECAFGFVNIIIFPDFCLVTILVESGTLDRILEPLIKLC